MHGVEIAGQKLFLPANFAFLRRLPARFEILVIGRGAEKSGLIAFELEVQGQRMVLKSGVDLKIGARYELEKVNETQYKLLRLVAEPEAATEKVFSAGKADPEQNAHVTAYAHLDQRYLSPPDLVAVKLLEEDLAGIERRDSKFYFDWEKKFSLSGVFIPIAGGGGGYVLFLAGKAASNGAAEKLLGLMTDLPVKSIRCVSHHVLESIAAGAIDLKS